MTHKKWIKLTPDERRIKAAELNGECLMVVKPAGGYYAAEISTGFPLHIAKLPDYLNDLNAMHEAEEIINQRDLRVEYMEALDDLACQWGLCHATAAQRAEAFVLTLEPE